MKTFAIIVAGGMGKRMDSATPKQFLLLHGKPLLYYTLRAFLDAEPDVEIILVLPAEYLEMGKEIVDAYFDTSRILFAEGGETRFHSVQNGLGKVDGDGLVLVHDGVRCLVSPELIRSCIGKASESGSAVPVVPVRDSVRQVEADDSVPLPRHSLVYVQTPQAFHSRLIKAAFEIDYKEKFTDEATVVETLGLKIELVPGEESNIKVTYAADLLVAAAILELRNDAQPALKAE